MTWLRSSYEARVLVVPFGLSGLRVLDEARVQELDGLMVLEQEPFSWSEVSERRVRLAPFAERGWAGEWTGAGRVGEVVGQADMAVLVASDPTEVPPGEAGWITGSVREHGGLLAAVLVGHDASWESPQGRAVVAELREAVDMVVILRGPGFVPAFLDVLRGGERSEKVAR